VVEFGKPAWRKIKEGFGEEVLNEDGTINRKRLAAIVFSDKTKGRLLNSITHPEIMRVIVIRIIKLFLTGK